MFVIFCFLVENSNNDLIGASIYIPVYAYKVGNEKTLYSLSCALNVGPTTNPGLRPGVIMSRLSALLLKAFYLYCCGIFFLIGGRILRTDDDTVVVER